MPKIESVTPDEEMTLGEQLQQLEESLLRNVVRKDIVRASALLADGFREIGSSGRIYDKNQVLQALQNETEVTIDMLDFACMPLSDHAAVITYRSVRVGSNEDAVEALRSSVWVRREDRWQLLFHQATRTTGGQG
jgi:hypothetical protein